MRTLLEQVKCKVKLVNPTNVIKEKRFIKMEPSKDSVTVVQNIHKTLISIKDVEISVLKEIMYLLMEHVGIALIIRYLNQIPKLGLI